MMTRIYPIIVLLFFILSCEQSIKPASKPAAENYPMEKKAILKTLQNETAAACARDYDTWKTHWIHRPSISKTYINFAENTFSEMTSWTEIDDFVKTYILEHPEPVPPPMLPENVHVELYISGAWVSYEILDETVGRKRETRLMEKENDTWKIAGMHTTIYGFDTDEK